MKEPYDSKGYDYLIIIVTLLLIIAGYCRNVFSFIINLF